jgi:hypothetical protein
MCKVLGSTPSTTKKRERERDHFGVKKLEKQER